MNQLHSILVPKSFPHYSNPLRISFPSPLDLDSAFCTAAFSFASAIDHAVMMTDNGGIRGHHQHLLHDHYCHCLLCSDLLEMPEVPLFVDFIDVAVSLLLP